MKKMTSKPSDQAARDRFITELRRNFSVIAPAGVGKTAAIVDRVIEIATQKNLTQAAEWLPKLVVVTYTNRAADEMQQRARNAILRCNPDLSTLARFNRVFFGTIHSFCLNLLRTHGYHLGLSSRLELVQDEDQLWFEFIRQLTRVDSVLSEGQQKNLFRHVSMLDVIELGRKVRPWLKPADLSGNPPEPDLEPVLACPPNGKAKGSVERGQELLRQWHKAYEKNLEFLPFPKFEKGGAAFQTCWRQAFAPLWNWLSGCSLITARQVASEYHKYRLAQGQLTYDDQVALAVELMDHPEAGRQIREEGYRVILDEAQDADPQQFRVLIEITRPPEASGDWLKNGINPPRDGHFCMVGDPQQSIYGERANLAHYLETHECLTRTKPSEKLIFEVTFRCDQAIIETVNCFFPKVLHGQNGQVDFVPLKPRPVITEGQVVCWKPRFTLEKAAKSSERVKAQMETDQLADWLKKQGFLKLNAPAWSEVAILCPRKRWLAPLIRSLQASDIPVQIQSTREVQGDSPAYAWLTSLLVIISEPQNHFEVVGVLREIFGISDHELAEFSDGHGAVFQIKTDPEEISKAGVVAETLRLLAKLRKEALELSLYDAVRHMVQASRLRERLLNIPELRGAEDELDDLLIQTASAEANGLSLQGWTEVLKRDFKDTRKLQHSERDGIQLITSQKAKGLQWHTVVVPFFFRRIHFQKPSYPHVIHHARNQSPMAILDSNGMPEDVKAGLDLAQQQEMQRILYVTFTRTKRTLVLVDDFELFAAKDRKMHKNSMANYLDIDGNNHHAWQQLTCVSHSYPMDASLPSQGRDGLPPLKTQQTLVDGGVRACHPHGVATVVGPKSEIEIPPQVFSPISRIQIQHALEHAQSFPRRLLPHTLAKHHAFEEPEFRHEPDPEWRVRKFSAKTTDYGTWWHETIQKIPWKDDRKMWNHVFQAGLASSPDAERGEKEWTMFLKSDLAQKLMQVDLIIHVEMPFLCRQDEIHCMEGFVDLAALDPRSNQWLVLDWKTNRITPAEVDSLAEIYSLQVRAYVEAIKKLTDLPAKGSLYSTATGQWVSL